MTTETQDATVTTADEAPVKQPKGPGVGDIAKQLIREGKTNEEVLSLVKEQFPEAKTSMASINWYRNKMRGDGEDVPTARELKADTKAELKAQREAERAEKKAALEAERAEAKAKREAERAEKKAQKEAEKAEAKAKREAEKAEKAKAEAERKAAENGEARGASVGVKADEADFLG